MATARKQPDALGVVRWPLGPRVPARAAKHAWMVAAAVIVASTALAVGPWTQVVRALTAAGVLALGATFHIRLARRTREPEGWLIADVTGLRRIGGGRQLHLASWEDRFGVTVLARADRARFVLALTSPRATRFVPVCATEGDLGIRAKTLLDRAVTVAESDLPAEDGASLGIADAERLLQLIAARVPGALDRVCLIDATGEPIVLERGELRVGTRRFDLCAPIEWRAFIYQELGSHAASLCQATWVRQGEGELFLVAPMPADTAWLHAAPDARLMQAAQGEPPPRELRRAIDHLFMMPLRRALARAPYRPRASSSSSITHSEPRL